MKIAIHSEGFDHENLSGPWLALREFCKALLDVSHQHDILFFHYKNFDREIYRKRKDLIVPRAPILMPYNLISKDVDVVLLNSISTRLTSIISHSYPGIKKIAYQHGALPWVADYAYGDIIDKKESKLWRKWTKCIMRLSSSYFDHILLNSNFTKRVAIDSIEVSEEKCSVVRYGVNHETFNTNKASNQVFRRDLESDNYVIFVANKIFRKNYMTVFRAFQEIKNRGYDGKLAVVGKGWSKKDANRFVEKNTLEDIVFTGFVQHQEVSELYRHAQISVFPTLHETFGMPILESMACGCPVVSSSHTAVPEVANNAALLASNPLDHKEVAKLMWNLISDNRLYNQKVEKGVQQAGNFTWKKSAKKFLKVLENKI